jgi:hypothetical protein
MQDANSGSVPAPTFVVDGNPPSEVTLNYERVDLSRRPRKVSRAELLGEFTGLWADVWTNPKRRVFKQFASGDGDSQDEVLALLIVAHNLPGLPLPLTTEALNDLDTDVYLALVGVVADVLQAALSPKVTSPTNSKLGSLTSSNGAPAPSTPT